MKASIQVVVPLLALGSLAVLVPGMSAFAADLPWIYDTSKRVEPVPCAQVSSGADLAAKAQDANAGAADWFSSVVRDQQVSPGIDLTTLPIGFLLFFR